jgi:hypothetical protein
VTFPSPKPGLVVRYAFLWSHERDAGADEAAKDRPCAIVVAASRRPDGELRVVVSPITHRPPDDTDLSIEIPRAVCRTLGFDDGRHWLRLDEINSFVWPGFDLRPIPGSGGDVAYGILPEPLFARLRRGILDRQARRRVRIMPR